MYCTNVVHVAVHFQGQIVHFGKTVYPLFMNAKRKLKRSQDATVTFRLKSKEKERFEKAVEAEDKYNAEVLRELMREYADKILGREEH
ncbi:hypothetical protein Pan161_58400 [Gimesia algae]|uniref:Uncharacterized protein n=2 Tax=Gimesia algae TaxID=2527971 RepID=A0A517VMA0_9PLAN|nr:hypothetical protein Pan161_58400 [Gimesia algae]